MYSLTENMRARRFYVQGGLTYVELAAETGISISQLKKWGKVQAWKTARQNLLAAALAGDSEAVRRQKSDEENVADLVSSISQRPKSRKIVSNAV